MDLASLKAKSLPHLRLEENKDELVFLSKNYIQVEEGSASGVFAGKSFCFTGELVTMKRLDAESLVKKNGGISMLSHVGEYVYTDKDSADHVGQKVDDYYVNKFARIFLDNQGSSVGMGINSATDAHTRCDRILYDQILRKTIPNGVVPWAFCFSDSHNLRSINK